MWPGATLIVAGENPRPPALNDNLVLEHSPGLSLKLKDLSRHVDCVLKSKAVKEKDVYGTFKYFCQTAFSFHVLQHGKSINFVFAFFS